MGAALSKRRLTTYSHNVHNALLPETEMFVKCSLERSSKFVQPDKRELEHLEVASRCGFP